MFADENLDDRFRLTYHSTAADTKQSSGKHDSLILDFSKGQNRELTMPDNQILNSVDVIPTEKLNPNQIGRKHITAKSSMSFDKQKKRDNSMYTSSQLSKNILLENSREQRLREIEDRKKNRAENRKHLSSLQRQFRRGKRLNEVRTATKFFSNGVRSEFSR